MIRVGDRLAQERRRRGLTLDEVAAATKIRPQFLQALEKGDYKKLPSSAYIQGFLKNYTQYLGLPTREVLALFRREFNEKEFLDVLPESFTKPANPSRFRIRLGPTTIIATLILLFIIGFVIFRYKAAFTDPSLTIDSPPENAVITVPVVTVSGATDPNTTLTINDIPVVVDKNGNYKKDIAVLAGTTEVTVKAINNFGRQSTVVHHLSVSLKPQQ